MRTLFYIVAAIVLLYGFFVYGFDGAKPSAPRYSPLRITWTEEDEAREDRAAEERDRGHVRNELRRIREELETMRLEQERNRLRDRLRSY